MAKVYLKFNTAVMKEIPLDKDEITFGRKSENDIVINHPTVSGRHGRLKKEADHFVVEDLNSTNGTFINGRRIKSGSVKDRDQIGVAGHILDFYVDDTVDIPLTAPVETHVVGESAYIPKPEARPKAEPPPAEVVPVDPPAEPAILPEAHAKIRILSGAVDGQSEVMLREVVTYIGAKPPATIKIKGFLAPDLAALITRRPEGYYFKAVKPGYPKVNGASVYEQVLLENGAVIEMAGSYMVFVKTH
jgi:pSer/pThr/pTyr-binding forkhead associated (FHA) protein